MILKLFLVLLSSALVFGCTSERADIVQLGPYRLTLTTDPSPPEVGRQAAMNVELRDSEDEPAEKCQLQMRQFMPGMEMSTDHELIRFQQGRHDGDYQADSHAFSMGGEWVLELTVQCKQDAAPLVQQFSYHVPWPE